MAPGRFLKCFFELFRDRQLFAFLSLLGPLSASILDNFPSFWHHFFEHGFCIHLCSILEWILTSLFMLFKHLSRSRTHRAKPLFLMTLTVLWRVLAFRKTMIFHDYPFLFSYRFLHWFSMSCGIDFGSILGAFSNSFPCFSAIGFWMIFRWHV